MAERIGPDEPPHLLFDDRAARACLGCLCAEPGDVAEGHWILLVMDADHRPLAIATVGLVFDFESVPVIPASDALTRAGYQHVESPNKTPWAATWRIIPPGEDRGDEEHLP